MKLITVIMDMVSGLQGVVASGEDKLKRLLSSIVWLFACVAIVSTLVLAAAGFILFGLFKYLVVYLPLPATALIVSVTALLLAVLMTGLFKWQTGIRIRH